MTSTTTTKQPLQVVTDALFGIAMKLDEALPHSPIPAEVWAIREAARDAAIRERNDAEQRRRVNTRIVEVHQYIQRMRQERVGWGPTAEREADETAASFLRGLAMLLSAEQVWCDGATGLSFGGVMPGGIVFGMIAHRGTPKFDHCTVPPIEWSFHS